jgi:hypothetical protein
MGISELFSTDGVEAFVILKKILQVKLFTKTWGVPNQRPATITLIYHLNSDFLFTNAAIFQKALSR